MSRLNLAGFLARSEVNGPGTRAVIWVQGCSQRCKGCFNPQFQPFSPATEISVDDLAKRILPIPDIEGVTFSGGETFLQVGPLAKLGERLRMAGLTVVTYTGYTPGQIAEGNDPGWPALLAVTDLLIAGPYNEACAEPDPLKGSANQQVISISSKVRFTGRAGISNPDNSRTELTITGDGSVITTGFPTPDFVKKVTASCRGT